MLADAITRAQSLDPELLAEALRATNLTDTFFGPISFTATGEATLPAICLQSQNKSLEIVSPSNLLTSVMEYPGIPVRPPKPKSNTAKRNRLIIGLTVGLGVLIIAAIGLGYFLMRSRYHLVFLDKDVKAEKDTWG